MRRAMVLLDLGDGLRGEEDGAAEEGGAGEEFGVLEERVDGAEQGEGRGAEKDDAVVLHENDSRARTCCGRARGSSFSESRA